MSDKRNSFLFEHGGMLQADRLETAPDADAMKVSELTFEDLLKRTAEFAAKSVSYYNDDNKRDGFWESFFLEVYNSSRVQTDFIEETARQGAVKPFLALLFAFFRMTRPIQDHLNTLTGRQMDFYFQDILGFRKRKGTEGHVTVLAELNRNTVSVGIPKGLLFQAGKDADGKAVFYESVDEMRLGKEEVVSVSHYSAASGYERKDLAEGTTDRKHALCIASPLFDMPGCEMTVSLSGMGDLARLFKSLRAEYTSEEGWSAFQDAANLTIGKDMPRIACYNPKIHGKGLHTTDPLIRFVSEDGTGALSGLNPSLMRNISVTVKDYVPPTLENKYGKMDNVAGVNPFGPDGKKGDWFDVILPFTAVNPEIVATLNEDGVKERDSAENLSVRRIRYRIKDDSCDQAKISRQYARTIIPLIKSSTATEADLEKAMDGELMAIFPRLVSPVQVTQATGFGTVSGMFLQHPCGVESLIGEISPIRRFGEGDTDGSAIYIGLKEVGPDPGQISLHMETSGKATGPGNVKWSYRNKGRWIEFDKTSILKDTTCGLSQDGIVVFDCKEPLPEGDGSFLDGSPCIRGVSDNDNCIRITGVRNRAIELAYSGTSPGAGPGGASLPKETISKTLNAVVGIKGVSQPFDGDVGIRAEDTDRFRKRVSERLRHKGRAWSIWDYETLVLEQFPEIAFVKCLSACQADGSPSPGSVTVIVVPQSELSCLKPTASTRLVNDVTKALQDVGTPFVDLHVISPSYQEVAVEATISLRPGYNDPVKYDALVNDALSDYLRPWIGYGDGQRFKDGDGVSDIIAFLESLYFVDVIEDLTVSVAKKVVSMDGRIERGSAVEVFTSAPTHNVKCHLSER